MYKSSLNIDVNKDNKNDYYTFRTILFFPRRENIFFIRNTNKIFVFPFWTCIIGNFSSNLTMFLFEKIRPDY